ncbi:unnamed protein product (macronuclear) [Paramecium tetraurelia]|uniref:non-specific serine/threonine protein kinase n=1 Tax=Paramecium tetraurelia TaxID=5888 RepID=A0D603_PARTE|nr:uncharacterized protein GSPATT00013900001 [Paramecium tetraurelia]CAK78470.1 unnamed protein product [Paramecium tetraurelia]|eukprot:XP_001445867.1 hypothetical protein (macronuclear) [Paramecium tetraurelia strain d4-2]
MTDSSSEYDSMNEGQYEAKIGETLKNNQYQIIKWLGDGTFSKVWLVKDLISSIHYALKIQSSQYSDAAVEEIDILKILNENENSPQWLDIQKNRIGNQQETHCVKMVDSFVHIVNETLHHCVVMEILGPTLLDLIRFYEKKNSSMSIQLGKEVTKQVLIGLIYAHEVCQIIHTDIKPENIMIELNDQQLKQLINDEEADDKKKKVKLNDINNGETFIWNENVIINVNTDLKFKLVDFGNACQTNQQFEEIQTKEYKSPESIIQAQYSTNTDVWSLACVIFEILTNDYLFNPEGDNEEEEMEDLLAMMIELIGPPTQSFLSKGKRNSQYFEKNGDLKTIKDLQKFNLSDTLIKDYSFEEHEAKQLQDFILFALKWDPVDRPSSQNLFLHPWLQQQQQ